MVSKIEALSYYLPSKIITNKDLQLEFPDYDFKSFEDKVGIAQRHVAENDETAMDLGVKACKRLFTKFNKDKIDFIIFCSQSPDYFLPTTACIIQDILNISKSAGALDINLGCSGFTYGISLAKGMIESGQAKCILLITAETYSKYIHPKDRSNRAIFGDAATATIISASHDENEIYKFLFGSDGSKYDQLIVKNGCSRFAYNANAELLSYGSGNEYTNNNLYMNGPEIFNFTNSVIPEFTKQVLSENEVDISDIDQFIFHQANSYMLNYLRKKLGIAEDKFYNDIKLVGNTVSSTIPIALKKYSQTINEKKLVLFMGFGVGLSWCGGIVKINGSL